MINHEHIKTWADFKALAVPEQLDIINKLLAEGHTVPEIMDSIGANRTTLGSHFKKLGYKRIDNEFKPNTSENISNMGEVKKVVSEPKPTKDPKKDKRKALEVYSEVHNILVDIDTEDYDRTSISIAKSTNQKLNDFLKDLKLLNKQDVITVAIEQFIAKHSN